MHDGRGYREEANKRDRTVRSRSGAGWCQAEWLCVVLAVLRDEKPADVTMDDVSNRRETCRP